MIEAEFEDIYHALSRPETPSGLSRRRFLQAGLAAAGTVAVSRLIKTTPAWAAGPAKAPSAADGVLVLLYLGGGNDGLNTVVPLDDPAYAAARGGLAISPAAALPIGEAGL